MTVFEDSFNFLSFLTDYWAICVYVIVIFLASIVLSLIFLFMDISKKNVGSSSGTAYFYPGAFDPAHPFANSAPAPKAAPTAADVPDFVLQQPVVEEKPITPEPPVEEAIDLTDIKNTEVEKDGDRFELADEQVTNIMVLGKDNREERRELTKNWKQIEALKGHPTIGNLATLLAEGHPFCLCKEALLLTFNFTRLKNQANVKANQAAISAMVEKLLGRKVFVYSLDRLDCNKYYTDFSNKEQLNKLPNKKEIQLELPKGE